MNAAAFLVLTALAALASAAAQEAPAVRALAEGRFIHALTSQYMGDDTTAARLLTETLRLRPNDAAVFDAFAETQLAIGNTSEALYFSELAIAARPDIALVSARHGLALEAAGRSDDALQTLEDASEKDRADPEIALALAQRYAQNGRIDDARRTLQTAASIGTTPEIQRALRDLSPTVDLGTGRSDPGEMPSPGRAAFEAGRFEEAADDLARLVDADPRRLDAWPLLLTALARVNDPRIKRYADDAVLLFPSVPSILAPAAEAYLAAGMSDDARRAAESGLAAVAALGDETGLQARLEQTLTAATR